jgi:hypothetical protein
MVQKVELMPNEVKLEGMSNYLSWSRRALLILRTKGLDGHVQGSAAEPEDKGSADWKKWSATDSLIFAWLLNSLTPSIAASAEGLPNAAEVWSTLSKMYSGKGNLMLMAQIEDVVHDLRQGEKDLMVYVAELQRLWSDLDHCDPLELPHSECVVTVKQYVERRRVMKFLKGLNSCFESRRATLLHQPKLPSLDEAISAMSQEEVRLKSAGRSEQSLQSAFAMTTRNETRDCFTCGESGHLSRFCTSSIRGRGRGYNYKLRWRLQPQRWQQQQRWPWLGCWSLAWRRGS